MSWFLQSELIPFAFALSLFFLFLIVEIVGAWTGFSFLGDSDADMDLNHLDLESDIGDFDGPEADIETSTDASEGFSLVQALGIGKTPFIIWLASFLVSFGLLGAALQTVLENTFGSPIRAIFAVLIVIFPAIIVTRHIANLVAYIVPKTETSAVSLKRLSALRGTVSQGTAKRGQPAEVRVKDRHGNVHYLRAEPVDDDGEIKQGQDVFLVKRENGFFIYNINDGE